jgi:Polyketide cyclase / dehydrase and lipid transport
MQRMCSAEVVIQARPEAIWPIVSDVTRVGEWSGECRGCVWESPASHAEVGARFRGKNRRSFMRWSRVNQFFSVREPEELVWRTMPSRAYKDSVEWRITLTPDGDRTRVRETLEVIRLSRAVEVLLGVVLPAHKDRSGDLAEDLGRLKTLIESSSVARPQGNQFRSG